MTNRYETYAFHNYNDTKEKGTLVHSGNDLDVAIETGAETDLSIGGYFGVFDPHKNRWVRF